MTDDVQLGSDEEQDVGTSERESLEKAALARKRRLLALKSRVHGVEMQEEDYAEDAKVTKKAESGEVTFRNYGLEDRPFEPVVPLDIVEREIQEHLKDTENEAVIEKIDVSTLAPRKVDWDLKRDTAHRLEKLERRTQRAIADLLHQRLRENRSDDIAAAVSTVTDDR